MFLFLLFYISLLENMDSTEDFGDFDYDSEEVFSKQQDNIENSIEYEYQGAGRYTINQKVKGVKNMNKPVSEHHTGGGGIAQSVQSFLVGSFDPPLPTTQNSSSNYSTNIFNYLFTSISQWVIFVKSIILWVFSTAKDILSLTNIFPDVIGFFCTRNRNENYTSTMSLSPRRVRNGKDVIHVTHRDTERPYEFAAIMSNESSKHYWPTIKSLLLYLVSMIMFIGQKVGIISLRTEKQAYTAQKYVNYFMHIYEIIPGRIFNVITYLFKIWINIVFFWLFLPFRTTSFVFSVFKSIFFSIIVLFLNKTPGGSYILKALNGHIIPHTGPVDDNR